mmetsp:Transcript_59264/g.129778  ORF Transcript_59264/g.129778 Transcript_59264/m.129778 type:complete len:99 (+) Transcript_59264:55-351(+)|eukprot:CAMPEP_0204277976 /NCGR_PEP_ID=MMETSP0468-20130131/29611_1 /ASSEMBLY_ACC=CAM_ASM_000383 /TAXON_ID=2969 /ORGANISM="Oxyrrhis marina" /LENGTH=98 /DNA_ID=CAMNT_0051254833 /DNA_START=52 /DNA_END=348 /DNA_ORIENTATION=+
MEDEPVDEPVEDSEELTLTELIDKFLSIDLGTLQTIVIVACAVLFVIGGIFAYTARGTPMFFLHCGFMVIVICLLVTVLWVVDEARRLQSPVEKGKDD